MSHAVRKLQNGPPSTPGSVVRLVIVGFMGAGKSTVGPLLANRLGWTFVDLDDEVARRAGDPVDEIVRARGIDAFRRLESDTGREVMQRTRVVVATGGGWAAEPGHMGLLGDDTVSVWLRVSAATALARVAESEARRPLLEVADPLARATSLLARRRQHYRRCDVQVDTEHRTPDEVVRDIVGRLIPRGSAGEREQTQ